MSNRTIIELNHDNADWIEKNKDAFCDSILGFLRRGCHMESRPPYGTVYPTRHHSDSELLIVRATLID